MDMPLVNHYTTSKTYPDVARVGGLVDLCKPKVKVLKKEKKGGIGWVQ